MIIAVLLCALCACSDSYKILLYNSKFAHSHSHFVGSIADTLVEAGHNVTTLIADIDTDQKDGTYKSQIIRIRTEDATKERAAMTARHAQGDLFMGNLFDVAKNSFVGASFGRLFSTNCRTILTHDGLLEKLKAEKFDVMITENFDVCGTGLTYVIKPKSTILISASFISGPQFEEFGIPASLSFNPSSYMSSMRVNSMWDRVMNFYAEYMIRCFLVKIREDVEPVFRSKYGNDFPSIEEISSHAAYGIVNTEPLLDIASPTLNRIIYIGGIAAKPTQKLDKHWLEVLGRRKQNVLVSFGSIAKSKDLRPDIKMAILKTASNFPDVTFIWKYENLEDDFVKANKAQHPNIAFVSWTPQNDILAHENMSVFMTHGGMGSLTEAATRGVPVLVVPLFGDQPRNAAATQHNGIGKVFDKFSINDGNKLSSALRELLNDDGYKKRAVRMSRMLASKPFKARELLIKHVEFAAEFGPSASLRPQSYDMTFIEYHNLDIVFIFVMLSGAIIYFTTKLIRLIVRQTAGASKKEDKEE